MTILNNYYIFKEKHIHSIILTMGKKPIEKLPEVEKGGAINDLIKEFNGIIGEWTDIYKPVTEWREKTLGSCSMEMSPGASIKDALLGLVVTMVCDLNMTKDDILKAIKFKTEAPYIEMTTVDKYMKIYESIKEWVMSYIDVSGRCEEF